MWVLRWSLPPSGVVGVLVGSTPELSFDGGPQKTKLKGKGIRCVCDWRQPVEREVRRNKGNNVSTVLRHS